MANEAAHDFDFIDGRWNVHNRKLRDNADPDCNEWVEPMAGGFEGGHGIFFGEDVINGRDVRLRFDWHADASSPTWEQRFSFDGGTTWILNWVMNLTRRND